MIHGSCHCGEIAFTLDENPTEAMQCNCSICRRKGYLLTFAPADRFTLAGNEEAISTYSFGKHQIQHQFCSKCGCAPFGHGTGPGGMKMVAVNLRCCEDVDVSQLKINEVDGASL